MAPRCWVLALFRLALQNSSHANYESLNRRRLAGKHVAPGFADHIWRFLMNHTIAIAAAFTGEDSGSNHLVNARAAAVATVHGAE